MTPTRPIIRQFGSKTRVADQLLALMPPRCVTWVEVFCGTGALTLAKCPFMHKDEHLNDLNGDIVNLFRTIRDPASRAQLCEAVALTPWAEAEYWDCRARPLTGEAVEDARRYLVRSWQGMAGSSVRHTSWIAIDRATKRRTAIWSDLPERIGRVAERLKVVAIHQKPALAMVDRFAKYRDAVLFIDPPYPRGSINSRDAYAVDMTAAEHAEFAERLRTVEAAIVMTMAPGTLYDRVLADWWHLPLMVRGLRNTLKEERVFLNFDPREAGLFAPSGAKRNGPSSEEPGPQLRLETLGTANMKRSSAFVNVGGN